MKNNGTVARLFTAWRYSGGCSKKGDSGGRAKRARERVLARINPIVFEEMMPFLRPKIFARNREKKPLRKKRPGVCARRRGQSTSEIAVAK